jgi:hypothetical protein
MGSALHEALGSWVQLGEIARPGIFPGGVDEIGGQLGCRSAWLGGDGFEHVGKKVRDILTAVTQGRNGDSQGSEALGEVRRKTAGTDQGPKASFGERNDPWSLWSPPAYETQQAGLSKLGQSFGTRKIEHSSAREVGWFVAFGKELVGLCRSQVYEGAMVERGELIEGMGNGFSAAASFSDEQRCTEVRCDAADLAS